MPGRRRYSDAQIEAALRTQGGIMSTAAQALEEATGVRISRQAIRERVLRSPRLQRAIHEAQEETLDLAEGVLLTALRRNDRDAVNAARFVLETKGKTRGYSRREYLIAVDPRKMSDAELDKAIAEAERTLVIDAEPVRALPAPPIKRPRSARTICGAPSSPSPSRATSSHWH